MLKEILYVGAGSFVGGALRYTVSLIFKSGTKGFPWATFSVNLAGCLLIGLLWGWLSRNTQIPSGASLFLTVGLCGGFTTFSTFSKESLQLLQAGDWLGLSLYVAGSFVLGLLLVAAGYQFSKY